MSVVAGYRRLVRSVRVAFAGDHFAIGQAKKQLKEEFRKNSASTNIEQHLAEIDDIDTMLRFHIVQGRRSDKGNFEVTLQEEHHTTIAAGQHLQHGPELEPIDPSYVGKGNITISKAKADKKPVNKDELM